MPLVEAAANVNTYSENLDPFNISWQMGKNIYFAQTFPLATGSKLFRTGFLVCCHTPFDNWRYSIRATDGAGNPLAVDLTMKERTSTNSPICAQNRPGWQTIDWPFDTYSAGTYALVLARPGSPDTQRAEMHGITPATTTASHKTWRSLDYGVTWTEIADTELCHAVYGYTPPPDPPPPAAIGNWYITNIVQTLTPTGYQIVVTTNVPAHLFLRWTLAPPGQHIKEIMARGAPVQKIIDQCFVATTDINQAEAGDTLVHTFIIEPWPVCQTRWFYFWGTRVMYRQPSVSPIYEKHRLGYAYPPVTADFYSNPGAYNVVCDGQLGQSTSNQTWAAKRASAANSRALSQIESAIQMSASNVSPLYNTLTRLKLTYNLAAIPAGSIIQAASLHFFSRGKTNSWTSPIGIALSLAPAPPYDDCTLAEFPNFGLVPISAVMPYASIPDYGLAQLDILPAYFSSLAPGGKVSIGLCEGYHDIPNSPPSWKSYATFLVLIALREHTITARRPFLRITYQQV